MNMSIGNKLVSLINLLIFILLLSRSECGHIRCKEEERKALLLFKEGLIKDPDGFLSSWRTDDCCEWQGVCCHNRTSHVIELNLYGAGLVGVIPDGLGNLSKLQTLDLSNNYNLTARDLMWLSHLSSLRHLDLSGVNLSKAYDWSQAVNKLPFLTELKLANCRLPEPTVTPFPLVNSSSMSLSILNLYGNTNIGIDLSRCHGLFNYSSLTSINLGYTGIFGAIPEDFEKMKSLEHLDLSNNDLEGGVANSIWRNLTSLRWLDLSENRLNGRIPPNLWRLPKLEALMLRWNQFEGALPDFLPPSSLRILDIGGNKLNGTIPKGIGSLSELKELYFSFNHFEGQVSTVHLMNLTKLDYLVLSGNLVVLKFSPNWVPPFNLSWIGLKNCKMGPHFPLWLRSQKRLETIDISGSGIDDAIPKWFWDLSSDPFEIDLSNNNIHGVLPDLSLKLDGCQTLNLSSNNIEGPIPKLPAHIMFLDLSKNRFQGPITPLCDINNTSYLAYVDLSNNLLAGKIPDCLGQFKQLYFLNLANNIFLGSIPSSIGFLSEIQSLHLRNNSLEGELPTSLQQCKKLRVLDIGQNIFTGEIPIWLGRSLSNLIILSLRSNQFRGTIPSELCYLKKIHILDFSTNNIFGIIPKCLRNFSTMAQKGSRNLRIRLDYNTIIHNIGFTDFSNGEDAVLVWKGFELEYRDTLGLVKYIDLSSNELTGEIPSEITYLEGLVALNISRNKLHGKIPSEIGHLQSLEFLDLSRNHFSGLIPMSLSQLNSIGVLDLSNNNLSGKIPTSTQLQSFNASSYSGNPGLCGPPLPNPCPEDEGNFIPTRSIPDSQVQEDESIINQGFYAALGIGFAVGLCGTLGSLLLNSSWRVAYFRLVANIHDYLYVTIVVNMVKMKRLLKKIISN